jgi:hypothetical protein
MTLEQIEAEVLLLPKDSLARLLTHMFKQLTQLSEINEEFTNEWIQEAEIRDEDMTNGKVIGSPASQVFNRLRGSLQ